MHKSCFHYNHLNQNSEEKKLPDNLFWEIYISHIEIYTKRMRVFYRPILVIQLHVFLWFHSWYKWQQLGNHACAQQWCTEMYAYKKANKECIELNRSLFFWIRAVTIDSISFSFYSKIFLIEIGQHTYNSSYTSHELSSHCDLIFCQYNAGVSVRAPPVFFYTSVIVNKCGWLWRRPIWPDMGSKGSTFIDKC